MTYIIRGEELMITESTMHQENIVVQWLISQSFTKFNHFNVISEG